MAVAIEEKLLLTINEASEKLNLARSYVYSALVTPGVIKSVKIGRRRLIPRHALEAYVRQLEDDGSAA